MSSSAMLRPFLRTACSALAALIVHAAVLPAAAQSWRTDHSTRYTPPSGMASPPDRYGIDGTRPGIWQGFYLGFHGGYGWATVSAPDIGPGLDLSGALYGMHAGYNWQMREWLLGLEVDAAWSNMEASRSVTNIAHANLSNDWLASIRLRGGYTYDQLLVYVTAGIAFADADARMTVAGFRVEDSTSLVGYVVGGGLEVKLAPNLSARVEGLYYGFGERTLDLTGVTIPLDASTATVRAGLTFHFN